MLLTGVGLINFNYSSLKRLVPIARTNVHLKDILFSSIKNSNGLNEFKRYVGNYFGYNYSCTYTSFMRCIYDILLQLKHSNPEKSIVIIPRYSCPSFSHAIRAANLKICYCDNNPTNLNMDLVNISQSDIDQTLALISVNHFGLCNPMDKLSKKCKKHGIALIEDLGYSLGSKYKNKILGTFGDYTILNFKEGKALPIGGAMALSRLESFGDWTKNRKKGSSKSLKNLIYPFVVNPHIYFFVTNLLNFFNFNYRRNLTMEDTLIGAKAEEDFVFDINDELNEISDFQASLGLKIFKNFKKEAIIRIRNAIRIEKSLSKVSNITLIRRTQGTQLSHYLRYPLFVELNRKEDVCDNLVSIGIEARDPYYEVLPEKAMYPGSYKVRNNIITIPTNSALLKSDIFKIGEILNNE